MKSYFGVAAVGCLLVACGGKGSSKEADAAGAGGDAPSGGTGGDSPVAPPAQGAIDIDLSPASPPVPGQACPSNPFTSSIPQTMPTERLDADNYTHKVIDGEDGALFACRVAAVADGWAFEGEIQLGGRALRIVDGKLSADLTGTATITIVDSQHLPSSLMSSEPATVNAKKAAGNNFQVKSGSMWAMFEGAVVAPPTSLCAVNGFFVLENCAQE